MTKDLENPGISDFLMKRDIAGFASDTSYE